MRIAKMAHGNADTGIDAARTSTPHDETAAGGLCSIFGTIFGPIAASLGRLRDLAAAPPDAKRQSADERPYLDTIAFREVLPILEERHLLLSEIKEMSRRGDEADSGRLAALQKQHNDTLPELLERLEKASMCVHSRCHHDIRDMLENVVLFDNFVNDFYLRNICNTMMDAIERAPRDI